MFFLQFDLCLYGFSRLSGTTKAMEFMEILESTGEWLIPKKINDNEPIKIPFSKDNLKEVWNKMEIWSKGFVGSILFQNDYVTGSITWDAKNTNTISLWTNNTKKATLESKKAKQVVELAKKLFLWANSVYGYGAHPSQGGVHYTPGLSYMDCLGGITWLALFGPPYVEMFGRERLLSAPCYVEEFAKDRFLLMTSEEPREPDEELLALQERVKQHLGVEAFYRHDEPRQTVFTWEDIRQGKHLPNAQGYRSPDFSAYLGGKVEEK